MVLGVGVLLVYRAFRLRAPVIVDFSHYPATVSVPVPRLRRLYRSVVVASTDVVGVDLVRSRASWHGGPRWRLAVTTTSTRLLSDAITSPASRRHPYPLGPAVAQLDALREALRLGPSPVM
ncbi:hypothetical protein [Nocardioides ultimimeridianus]